MYKLKFTIFFEYYSARETNKREQTNFHNFKTLNEIYLQWVPLPFNVKKKLIDLRWLIVDGSEKRQKIDDYRYFVNLTIAPGGWEKSVRFRNPDNTALEFYPLTNRAKKKKQLLR